MRGKLEIIRTAGIAACAGIMILIAGCCSLEGQTFDAPEQNAPAVKRAPARLSGGGCPVVGRQGGNIISRQAFPTGSASSSVVMLEKVAPEVVNVAQDFEYTITVSNLTDCELDSVVVTETIASGLNYKSSTPSALKSGNLLTWNVGTLAGKDSKVLKVKAAAASSGSFTDCARVTYQEKLCTTIKAVAPKLVLTKSAPAKVLLCDIIPIKLSVKNSGTGIAKSVVITDNLPAGLKTIDGKSSVSINAGDLASGESKNYTVNTQATRTGKYDNKAVAKSAGGLSANASSTTVVQQPVLAITKTASRMVFFGRPITYKVTVTNKGDAASANTILTDRLPAGAKFISATGGGELAKGVITWNLGTLAPNASKSVSVKAKAMAQGELLNRAEVKGTCAAAVAATAKTVVKGIPAVLLEVIDIEDPIEVGDQEVYVIKVTNQGSAAGTNIAITCTLEDTQSYISSSGDTRGTISGKVVKFAPLASLAPRAKAEWRVTVKAIKASDVRFSVEMNTDQLSRPVNENESTNQY